MEAEAHTYPGAGENKGGMVSKVTICECGLAECYHEGTHDIAVHPHNGQKPVCTGYKPRPDNWWKVEQAREAARVQAMREEA